MENKDLIEIDQQLEIVEYIETIITELRNTLIKSKHSLNYDYTPRTLAIKLNDLIYEIFENGAPLIKKLCKEYQNMWID